MSRFLPCSSESVYLKHYQGIYQNVNITMYKYHRLLFKNCDLKKKTKNCDLDVYYNPYPKTYILIYGYLRSLSSVCFKLISIILLYNTEISPHPISFFFLVSMTSECWEVPALNHINSISWNHLWYLPFLYADVSRSFKFFFTVTTVHSPWSLMCIPHLSILTSHPCQSLFLKSLALQSDSSCVL